MSMSRRLHPSAVVRLFGAALALWGFAAGCGGSAKLNLVSLNLTNIDPPAPKTYTYEPSECYYWLDASGQLNIAMKFETIGMLIPLTKVTLAASFVLPGPPAGSGRDYTVTSSREARMRFDSVAEQHAFTSAAGVVSVVRRQPGRFQGSFRLLMQHFPGVSLFSLLPQRPGTFLLYGTFNAIEDAAHGQKVLAASEAGGFERPPARPGLATAPAQATTPHAATSSRNETPTTSPTTSMSEKQPLTPTRRAHYFIPMRLIP